MTWSNWKTVLIVPTVVTVIAIAAIFIRYYPEQLMFRPWSAVVWEWQIIALLAALCVVVYFLAPAFGEKNKGGIRNGMFLFGPILFGIWFVLGAIDNTVEYASRPPTTTQVTTRVAQQNTLPCPVTNPCTPIVGANGSTPEVAIPDGVRVCFDPSFWDNLPKLGYTTSYRGGQAQRYTCTKEEVLARTCAMSTGDRFWFNPEPDVPIPSYSFRRDGGNEC